MNTTNIKNVDTAASSKAKPMVDVALSGSTKNLVDTAAGNASFKIFSKAVEQAGMGETLRGEGPFTIFAPTDTAFEKLPAGRLDTLMQPENKEELVTLLNNHVIRGRKSAADIGKWQTAKTVGGQTVPVKLVGEQVSIGGANLTSLDIDSSNGLIHGIDQVNIPTKQ